MAGPWEKYAAPVPAASASNAPWLKYSAPVSGTRPVSQPNQATPGFNADGTPDLSGVMGGPGEAAQNTPSSIASQLGQVVTKAPGAVNDVVDATYRNLPFIDRAEAGLGSLGQMVTGRAPDYSGNLAASRADMAADSAELQKRNPGAEILGKVAGTAAVPLGAVGAVARGAPLVARMAGGALAGGLAGSLQGASNSPDWTDLKQTALDTGAGGATGALLGAAIPAVGAGIGAAYRWIGGKFVPAVEGVGRGAAGKMNELIDNMGGAQAVRGTLASLGPEARLADAGQPAQSLTMGIATGTPGQASNDLVNTLAARAATTPSRIGADVTGAMGPHFSANEAADHLRAAGTAARTTGGNPFAGAPPVDTRAVIRQIDGTTAAPNTPLARTLAHIRSTLVGPIPAPVLPPQPTSGQYRQWLSDTQAWEAEGHTGPVTDALTLQRAKQSMDGLIQYQNGKPVGIGPMEGADETSQGIIKGLRARLNNTLRDQVPGYARQMDQGASVKQQLRQLDVGANDTFRPGNNDPYVFNRDWNATTSPDGIGMAQTPVFSGGIGLQQAWSTLTPQQLARQIGMRHAVQMAVDNSGNDLTALSNITRGLPDANGVGAGNNLQNIETAFGQPSARQLADAINRERTFAATNTAAAQGSKTAGAQAGQAAAQPPAPFQLGGEFHNITGPAEAALGATHGTVNAILRAAQSGNGTAYRNDMARMLAARLLDPVGQQVLARNAALAANRAMSAPVTDAASQIAKLPAAALGALLSQQQKQRQLQGH